MSVLYPLRCFDANYNTAQSDVSPALIMKRVEAASGARYTAHKEQARKFEPIGPVGTSYTPIGRPDMTELRRGAPKDVIDKVVSSAICSAQYSVIYNVSDVGHKLYSAKRGAGQHPFDSCTARPVGCKAQACSPFVGGRHLRGATTPTCGLSTAASDCCETDSKKLLRIWNFL